MGPNRGEEMHESTGTHSTGRFEGRLQALQYAGRPRIWHCLFFMNDFPDIVLVWLF